MSEQKQALEALEDARVLDGLRWAARSSASRVLSDYDSDTGHDQGWLGYSHHKLLKDRMDRVFSCGKYAVPSSGEDAAGLDVLGAGLDQEELLNMPLIPVGVVHRDELNGSPGWRAGEWRWLLASFRYGEGERIHWVQKSPTKQRVAAQPRPDQLMIEDEQLGISSLGDDAPVSIPSLMHDATTTLVLGHSLDPFSGGLQLPFGRPRLNLGGGDCWYWVTDLAGTPGGGGGGRLVDPVRPGGQDGQVVADAPVRLRRRGVTVDGTSNAT
ncbi:hypothetical protein [Pseudokineococcus lusitanus]|nr:hypothetical protein [Pseudokineococcus lusitanus]